ncbi:hypothetical protein Ct9H90mP29_03940 [bacterium]|nr:MAG: hypothetical protein Ct9H90mP29_03940 [bacterium]
MLYKREVDELPENALLCGTMMKQLKNIKSLLPNDLFQLDIVTPIRELKIGEVNYLRCPG